MGHAEEGHCEGNCVGKTEHVDLFRSKLFKTKFRNLTHSLHERFWMSYYMSFSGMKYIGHNVFAKLLMEIHDSLYLDRSQRTPTLAKPFPQRMKHFAFSDSLHSP